MSEPPDPRVTRAQAGDREALEALLGEVLPRVRNLVRYLVRGDDTVNDIAQEALIDVIRGLSTYRGDAPFPRWVDRICVRATFRSRKKSRVRREQEQAVGAELEALPPPDVAARYHARREVVRMLDGLPEAQRRAVVLHHVVGMTLPETADELGVPVETARSRIRLAMGRLRTEAREAEA